MNLYTNITQTKYYLIPTDLDLPTGDFVLRDSAGNEWLVDEQAVAEYEVGEDEVKAHIKAQARAAFGQLKESLLGSVQMGLTQARQEMAAQREAREAAADPEWVKKLLGFTADELAENPQVGEDWLRGVLDGVKTVLEGAASSDADEQQVAREVMDGVRARFTAAGIETNERMMQLPDQLQENVFNRDPSERANSLTELANQLEQTAIQWGKVLRAEADNLKKDMGTTTQDKSEAS